MATAPEVYFQLAARTREMIALPEVAAAWERPSDLEGMTVGDLCGHLLRAVSAPVTYLREPALDGTPVSAPEYYAAVMGADPADLGSETNRGVRERSRDLAAGGRDVVLAKLDEAVAAFATELEGAGPDRPMAVFGGVVMRLEDYLLTRIIELVVHLDDLSSSLGLAAPELPSDAYEASIAVLVGLARLRHGDAAVVRALTRRERDRVQALRVF